MPIQIMVLPVFSMESKTADFRGFSAAIVNQEPTGMKSVLVAFLSACLLLFSCSPSEAQAIDYNRLIVEMIREMPNNGGGRYAKYQKSQRGREFEDLYQTVADLDAAIGTGIGGKLKVNPQKAARLSFCSSATYLLFAEVLEDLQDKGLKIAAPVNREISDIGDKTAVIKGKMDGIGIFGHWNADGPGTAVLFQRLGLGTNFSSFEKARPGDFLKIFWNENIGKGERGHLVIYLGTSADGKSIKVWSSNTTNANQTSGYGTMWVEKSRVKRALFSRLEHPENLNRWQKFSESEKKSDYLIRIRKTGSTGAEMKKVTGALD